MPLDDAELDRMRADVYAVLGAARRIEEGVAALLDSIATLKFQQSDGASIRDLKDVVGYSISGGVLILHCNHETLKEVVQSGGYAAAGGVTQVKYAD